MTAIDLPAPTRQDRLEAAQAFIAAGRFDEADMLLEEAGATSDPDVLNARAALALARRKTDVAFDMLAEAATAYPDHAGLATNLGIAHEMLGRFDEAVICLERAAALAPDNEDVKLALAHALLSRGDIAEARSLTEAAAERAPDNARAFLQLGAIDLAMQDRSAAETALLRALELAPDDADTLRNVSTLLVERGRFEEALGLAERAHLRAPLNSAALAHLAYCRAAAGLWPQAEAACRKLLAYAPAHLGAREILARVTIARGDVDKGIAELTQFVRARKSDSAATLALARILQLVGRFDEALKLAEHVARTAPDDEDAEALQATLELTLGRFPPLETVALPLVTRVIVPPATGAFEFIALARLLNRLASQQVVRVIADARYQALLGQLAEQIIPDTPMPQLTATPLQSLLRILPVDARTIAGDVPYLRPQPELFGKWRNAFAEFKRPLVGIVWDGGALGLSMEQIAATLPDDVTPVSLTAGDRRHDMKTWKRPIDAGMHIDSPAEMVAAVANLDAVIGPDSFAVHVAGAMGIPGVVLVPRGYPWYWAKADGRPLWYPSFEVVAQQRLGDWSGAIEEGRDRLQAILATPAPG
jgi:tetratricopeptide (TPR) repeat protein